MNKTMTENEKQLKETEIVLMRLYQKSEITLEAFTILNDRNKQAINYTRCSLQFSKDKLDKSIINAKPNLDKIKDVDKHLESIR